MTERMVAAIEHPLDRRHRPPDRPQDRDAPALRGRHGRRDRGRGTHRDDARDQLGAGPARPRTTSTRARPPRPGVPIVIDSDAHGTSTLGITRWGIATARRAWLDGRPGGQHAPVGRVRAACASGARQRRARARRAVAGRRGHAPRAASSAAAARDDAVDGGAAVGRERRAARAPRSPGAGSSSAARSARGEVVADEPRVERAGERQRGVRARAPRVVTSRQPSASASSWATP